MPKILVSWVGSADLRGAQNEENRPGPVASALQARSFDAVLLLANYKRSEVDPFVRWLSKRTKTAITVDFHKLKSPTDFEEIFAACIKSLESLLEKTSDKPDLTFHLSPGTPHMHSTWLILSESRFPASLIDSSPEQGVKDVRLPVKLTPEWLPAYIRNRDARLEGAAPELPPEAAQFENIIYQSSVMRNVIYRASKVAPRSVPVLIEGESGTGKELFARAIHDASLKCEGPFIPVNCGALPSELIESILFGHEKGAFTGASTQSGKFEQANGGTLFLDELGELPKEAQVRFLRILEDKEVWRIGGKAPIKVDVRIITATNRSLVHEVSESNFREDLFYRLAVAVLKLPPLRQREGDIKLLIDYLMDKVNEESKEEPSYKYKKISPEGKNIMLRHPWPGNVRELLNTLRRLAVWSDDEVISAEEVQEGLLSGPRDFKKESVILGRDIDQDFDLIDILDQVEKHYVERAWIKSGKRKKEASEILGLANYQTFSKRLEKYGIK